MNILSIRSVNKKPLTIFVIEATTAIVPRTVVRFDFWLPARTIDPTTAMAEMALVNDISGVCSSRETFRITNNPVNVAKVNTNRSVR